MGTATSEIDAIILAQTRKVHDVITGEARRTQVESRKTTETCVRKCLIITCVLFPFQVNASVKAIIEAQSVAKLAELEALAATWDGEVRGCTR
jgi:hypothetical protein